MWGGQKMNDFYVIIFVCLIFIGFLAMAIGTALGKTYLKLKEEGVVKKLWNK